MQRQERRADAAATLLRTLRNHEASVWTSIPGIVESVDLERQTVTVQPATKVRTTQADGSVKTIPLPLLPDVPIVFPSGGGFALTFPIEPGDECLVVFSDRCIDAWWQSGDVQEQADQRMHDLSDGIAIFGPRSQPRKLSDVSADSVQLRSDDGTASVEISAAGITLTHPVTVTISAPATTIHGAVSMPDGATIGGVAFSTHRHTGVRAGSDTSGGAV